MGEYNCLVIDQKFKISKSKKIIDSRGYLVDFLKLDELKGENEKFGQIYYLTFSKKGAVRGNHYHEKKDEWFVVVSGKLKVILEDIKTKERVEFVLKSQSNEFERVYVSRKIAHSFISLTNNAMMINYCNKPYHSENPDTIKYDLV